MRALTICLALIVLTVIFCVSVSHPNPGLKKKQALDIVITCATHGQIPDIEREWVTNKILSIGCKFEDIP